MNPEDQLIEELVDLGLDPTPSAPPVEIDEIKVQMVRDFHPKLSHCDAYTVFRPLVPFCDNRVAMVNLKEDKGVNAWVVWHELGHVRDYHRRCYDPLETARRFALWMYLRGEITGAYVVGSVARGKPRPSDVDMVLFNRSRNLPFTLRQFSRSDRKAPWTMTLPKTLHSCGAFDIHIAAFGKLMPNMPRIPVPPTIVLEREQSASIFAEQMCRANGYEEDIWPLEEVISGTRSYCHFQLGLHV